MKLYDTASRTRVDFQPEGLVRLYVCGITPYDAAHMGHVATYLTFDVLQRVLNDQGHKTSMVRNITDIDDPLFERARRDSIDWTELGNREIETFREDMNALGLIPPDAEPRVTTAIDEVTEFAANLEELGFTYRLENRLYFAVDSFQQFGSISGLDRQQMFALARDNGGDVDTRGKRNPLDFLLWQPSASDEPSWHSPWGNGRPGWHIECSALANREFEGEVLDIHGGGRDLVFPHHECESAQTVAATGKPLARIWMHVGMVGLDGEKMSKSRGNLVFAHELLKDFEPSAIRLAVMAHHYRTDWEWSESTIERAVARLDLWRSGVRAARQKGDADHSAIDDAVRSVLDDDLDTPAALELIDEAAAGGTDATEAAALLGVDL